MTKFINAGEADDSDEEDENDEEEVNQKAPRAWAEIPFRPKRSQIADPPPQGSNQSTPARQGPALLGDTPAQLPAGSQGAPDPSGECFRFFFFFF